jgi:hypothetical protein
VDFVGEKAGVMTGLRTVSEREARTVLRHQLVGTGACDQVAADCALLRSCVWALTGGSRPVHILRLLNLATSLDPSSDDLRPRIKESLEELADAGDLAELANGRWLPAPTREVRLETADDTRLVVGGLPTSLLPPDLSSTLEHSGAFRRTKGGRLAEALALPSEDRASWMGKAPADLEAWTKLAFEGKYEAWRDDNGQSSIYAPELFSATTPQHIRWVERLEKLSGRYLCRQLLPFGLKRHHAAEIVGGKLTRFMNLRGDDLRRLMYGLDMLAGKSVSVSESESHTGVEIILKSELPKPERRFFAALGRLTVAPDAYYPRTWLFPVAYAAEVRKRLMALGIRIAARAHQ